MNEAEILRVVATAIRESARSAASMPHTVKNDPVSAIGLVFAEAATRIDNKVREMDAAEPAPQYEPHDRRLVHDHAPVSARHGTYQGHEVTGRTTASHRHAGQDVVWADGYRDAAGPAHPVVASSAARDRYETHEHRPDPGYMSEADWKAMHDRFTSQGRNFIPSRRDFQIHPGTEYSMTVPSPAAAPVVNMAVFWQRVAMALIREFAGVAGVSESRMAEADGLTINWKHTGATGKIRFWLTGPDAPGSDA